MGLVRSVVIPKTFLVKLGLAAWAGLLLFVVGTLMVGHWYTLPKPDKTDAFLTQALAELRTSADDGAWMGVHVLYTECRCSQRVFDHLFSSARPDDVKEKVILVGKDDKIEARARKSGFDVVVVSPVQLKEQFSLESAPLLLVVEPSGAIAYSGGYTQRKQGPDIRDVAIITSLMQNHAPRELPLYGCGTSSELQKTLDPLGIKY